MRWSCCRRVTRASGKTACTTRGEPRALAPHPDHAPCRYVRNLSSGGEGWVPEQVLSSLLGQRSSAGCLSSPGKVP